MTSGSHSTVLVRSSYLDKPRLYPVPPLESHELMDTNAAGDAFASGPLAAYPVNAADNENNNDHEELRRVREGGTLVGRDSRMCCGQVCSSREIHEKE
ncbi:hypothetical protein K435DRAFT_866607 [Dendrothele bispora CBS 962.96]|uniref:Uncharacterized protein n=1 Tax=Dendrothele bispora (strain CBS 962.96) TaxID=1314807 RepID=A0A4S8LGG3_DENBC|nr:hypothetical protein K435DRAFT_866607 [Dendrothele bispora CBS 962.96]